MTAKTDYWRERLRDRSNRLQRILDADAPDILAAQEALLILKAALRLYPELKRDLLDLTHT